MDKSTNMPHEDILRKDAVDLIRSSIKNPPLSEIVSLTQSVGRVTSDDVVSRHNIPSTASSRWDGISFNYAKFAACNGDVSSWELDKDYMFTNTGIGIFNDDFDTMVKIEDTVLNNGRLSKITQSNVLKGQNIIPVGEHVSAGDVLVPKNTLIKPSHLNTMASGGTIALSVYKKPIVALLPSGNELVSLTDTLDIGDNIESNTFSMKAKIEQWGGTAFVYPILKDDIQSIQNQIYEASTQADIIVIGGGTGRGQLDLLHKAIADIGIVYFSSVEHGPGKRTSFSIIENTPVIGLVGPPGGEEMTFDFYVIPAIKSFLNLEHHETLVDVILDNDVAPHSRVDFYFTLNISRSNDGELHASVLPHSNLDRSIADHNGYLFVPKGSSGYKKGTKVRAELRMGYENV